MTTSLPRSLRTSCRVGNQKKQNNPRVASRESVCTIVLLNPLGGVEEGSPVGDIIHLSNDHPSNLLVSNLMSEHPRPFTDRVIER